MDNIEFGLANYLLEKDAGFMSAVKGLFSRGSQATSAIREGFSTARAGRAAEAHAGSAAGIRERMMNDRYNRISGGSYGQGDMLSDMATRHQERSTRRSNVANMKEIGNSYRQQGESINLGQQLKNRVINRSSLPTPFAPGIPAGPQVAKAPILASQRAGSKQTGSPFGRTPITVNNQPPMQIDTDIRNFVGGIHKEQDATGKFQDAISRWEGVSAGRKPVPQNVINHMKGLSGDARVEFADQVHDKVKNVAAQQYLAKHHPDIYRQHFG